MENAMIKKSFIFKAILIIGLYLPTQLWSYPYTEIYVFGDSLSDSGRLFQAIAVPPKPYFDGRSSNGKVWVEYLATGLNLTYNPQTNFAWAGASTGTLNVWEPEYPDVTLWGLQQQVDSYLENTKSADSNALYIVWAGGIDFLGDVSDPQKTITTAITNLVTTVAKLRQHGAQHLMVANMPDLGKSPRGLASDSSAAMSVLTQAFNQALAENLQPFNVIQVDMPSALDVITDSSTFFAPQFPKLTNFTEACLDKKAGTVCDNPNQSFFWDDIHPSTLGHQAISLFFYAAIAEPIYMSYGEKAFLNLPLVQINSDASQSFLLDINLSDNPFDNAFLFTVEGGTLQSTKPLQNIFTFPSGYHYPTFEGSTGLLQLPIVHLVEPKTSADDALPFNVTAKYQVELGLMPNTTGDPLQAPLFGLTNAVLLTD